MGDPTGKYKSIVSSNKMLRDINKSLQHLHVNRDARTAQQQDSVNSSPHLQSQNSFEQQLALAGNINALTQSAAGERRSYPRAVTSNKAALEKIGKDLQPFAWRNGTTPYSNGYQVKSNIQFTTAAKSNSVADIHQVGMRDQPSSDQRKLSILVSNGYDEALVIEVLRKDPTMSVESIAELLNSVVAARKVVPKTQSPNRVQQTQTQRLFNVTPYAPRPAAPVTYPQYSQIRYNASTHHYKRPPTYDTGLRGQSYASNPNMYEPSLQRQYSANERSSVLTSEPHYSQYSQSGYSEQRPHSAIYSSSTDVMDVDQMQMQTDTGWKVQKSMEQVVVGRNYEGVTLRQKVERKLSPQNRWSAEVLHATNTDIPKKPPPPYPGIKKSLTRIPSQEAEIVGTNNPVTVIFDEKNDRVNVVGGIPEGYESVITSSPSSSGQSSPRLSKEPPPYNFASKQFSPQSSSTQITSNLSQHVPKQYSPQTSTSQPTPLHSNQAQVHQDHVFAVPVAPTQPLKSETHFMPIGDSPRKDRGSPPPYPGAVAKGSNRNSLNLDELESSVSGAFPSNNNSFPSSSGYYSSGSASSSKKTSTATEPGSFNQSDSSASTSPTPDGVERSYSPLPTFSNSPYHTMVIHPKEKKEEKCEVHPEKEGEPFPTRLKNYTPQAYKFYMEQHVENLLKLQGQRKHRRSQLEAEMARVGLPGQAQEEMRKLLNQKESNYIRLKRAKMERSMFTKVKIVGVGAFGEVTLVRKNGTSAYYAMKILRKSEVLRRNQVAHVKAERDILAEADNEWVVKLYYSFQDEQNLYFVMDYVPGGDLMALLIKLGIFQPPLALFYISELILAIESVHKLGFIHRDIKPDNVLIDKNGHIKLTDFGLCTGFRWTHDSKYYQPEPEGGGHIRQFSMEPEGGWESLLNDVNCNCKSHRLKYDLCKPLERRQLRRHMRCQAHSLVGTPNYIAPEVLMRIPYSPQCDWWSVGVILYEMLLGQPPFLAHSPAETQFKVISWRQTLTVPKHSLPKDAEDLIRRLCSSPDERIGKDGADEIKQHDYFRDVDFTTIHQEQAPFVPSIRNATDTSNFDPVPENMSNGSDSEQNDVDKGSKKGAEYAFYEFTFRHFFDDGGLANPTSDMLEAEAKPKKRSATTDNQSMSVPSKVPAHSPMASDEKAPVYV